MDIILANAEVNVSGTNSAGVWGASIGGGGAALMTDTSANAVAGGDGSITGQSGNAQNVVISLTGSKVTATGGAPAIIAHSIAGGGVSPADGGGLGSPSAAGGAPAWQSVATELTYYGLGIAGDAIVQLTGGSVATATDSSAIVAATKADMDKGNDGTSMANALVTIAQSTATNASADHPTIMLASSSSFADTLSPSILRNQGGTIANPAAGGYAVTEGGTGTQINITNSGTITGNIDAGTATIDGGAATPTVATGPTIVNRPRAFSRPMTRSISAPPGFWTMRAPSR